MSSSDAERASMNATPWSLDEFELPDIFAPIDRLLPLGAQRARAAAQDSDGESPQELARIEAAAYARGRADAERQARADAGAQVSSAILALSEAVDSVR